MNAEFSEGYTYNLKELHYLRVKFQYCKEPWPLEKKVCIPFRAKTSMLSHPIYLSFFPSVATLD
jgi:hypothetical protein